MCHLGCLCVPDLDRVDRDFYELCINRQNLEKMICRGESYLSKNIFLIAVRQTVPKISALKLCLYFLKIGAKNFFSWEKGYLNFSIRGSLSIIEAQYPSNVIAR